MMREMKDSGVEWIGEIPEDWEVCRFKNVAQLFTGNSIKDDDKMNYEDSTDARPYLATKDIDVIFSTANYDNGLYVKLDDIFFKVAPAGSTLMCIEGGSAGRKKTKLIQDVSFVNKLCCFQSETVSESYLYYFVCSPNYEKEFNNNITGLIGGVSVSVLKNIFFLLPPPEQQHRIADYLDNKCAKIDSIIAREQVVIEKLKAYKLSVITETVTKGLNPNVPMKDSGIEWIGKIPEHWGVAKVKNVSSVVTDGAHVSPETENGIYDFISTVNIEQDNIVFDGCLKTSEQSYKSLVSSGCKPQIGDILISKDGTVGRTVVVKTNYDFVISSSLVLIRPNSNIISSEFLNYNLQTNIVQENLKMIMHGAGLRRVSVRKNTNLPVILPTISNQKQICEFLDIKCSKINAAIANKQAVIDKLTEYKKSLIYEVVTGKKEV